MRVILILGGAYHQIPIIRKAKDSGNFVITCDYLPNNPGHKLSDKYYNASTRDKEKILEIAKENNADGIIAYASDPAAPTAAFVSEKLNLPGNSYDSVNTLARKDLFRNFLKKNNFNHPDFEIFEDAKDAYQFGKSTDLPVFVKPVDSSGSKGVSKVTSEKTLETAINNAFEESFCKKIIIEKMINKEGPQVAGDGLVIDHKIKFRYWGNENFTEKVNGLVPIGQTFPTTVCEDFLEKAEKKANEIFSALNFQNGCVNFDFIFDKSGDVYFLEIGPRNGGCRIPEVITYATNVDLIDATISLALGEEFNFEECKSESYYASYMIHSEKYGILEDIEFSKEIQEHILEKHVYIHKGKSVSAYTGSNKTIGDLILQFANPKRMQQIYGDMENHIKILLN
ncbi:ATP-grasp domain-containing protein [Opitutales bacterium]|nr:ATP-grasp domain-containing protein [Opitutales bacterium]